MSVLNICMMEEESSWVRRMSHGFTSGVFMKELRPSQSFTTYVHKLPGRVILSSVWRFMSGGCLVLVRQCTPRDACLRASKNYAAIYDGETVAGTE